MVCSCVHMFVLYMCVSLHIGATDVFCVHLEHSVVANHSVIVARE